MDRIKPRIKPRIKHSISQLLDCVYPRRCPICQDIVTPRGGCVCKACMEMQQPIREPRCKKCGKEISSYETEYCYDCQSKVHQYDQGLGIFPYNSIMKESISQFKYHGRKEYGEFYGKMAVHYGAAQIRIWAPQVLIPIPIHKTRLKKRGYNQAEVIAKWVGKGLKLPVATNVIKRSHNTNPQKELDSKERRRNLAQAFQVEEDIWENKPLPWERVLLIDDIYTTGSTIDAVSKCLKAKGIKKVYFLSVCIGKGF